MKYHVRIADEEFEVVLEGDDVTINGRAATINAPDLIGAIYGKCSALLNHLDRNVERHLGDIVLLASVVDRGDRRELGSLPQRAGTTPGRLMARDRGSA